MAINVRNLNSSQFDTKSESKFTFSVSNLGVTKRTVVSRTERHNSRKKGYVVKTIGWDNDKGYVILNGDKLYALEENINMHCECEYLFSTKANDYYKGNPYCTKNNTSWEKHQVTKQWWSLFCIGMKIKGYWKLNEFIIDTDSMNEWAANYYKKHLSDYEYGKLNH